MVRYDDIHSQCFKDTVFVYREIRKGGQRTRIRGRVRGL